MGRGLCHFGFHVQADELDPSPKGLHRLSKRVRGYFWQIGDRLDDGFFGQILPLEDRDEPIEEFEITANNHRSQSIGFDFGLEKQLVGLAPGTPGRTGFEFRSEGEQGLDQRLRVLSGCRRPA